jgi:hypothetical protein
MSILEVGQHEKETHVSDLLIPEMPNMHFSDLGLASAVWALCHFH